MKHIFRLLPLLLALAAGPVFAQATAPALRLMLSLREPLRTEWCPTACTAEAIGPAATAFLQLNRRYQAGAVQCLNPGSATHPDAPAMYLLLLPAGTDAAQAVRDYEASGLFYFVELDATGQGAGVRGLVPNDTNYGRQWGLRNDGSFAQSPARAGADIGMENAWAITTGDSSVTVAIIDSGCKLDHPDLAGRTWRNRAEIPGNNIDDDMNGYVDDLRGWNFVVGTNNPTDDHGHGTNVTGIIGATGNNSVGYAGINWACKLMVCKGLDSQNVGFYSWWISGIYYAVDNGARVINMSLVGASASASMQAAINYATQRGVVVVACMGNGNTAALSYPAACTGLIAVGSTNPDDSRTRPFFWSATSGSNFGPHISVVAPGNYIYGLSHQSNTNYNSYWGGTSQATPHVAGLVSLLLTRRPQLTPAQVKALLQTTADDRVGSPTEDLPGWDPYYGFGRVNAARALATLTATAPAQASAALALFPNPAHDALTVALPATLPLPAEARFFNPVGQLVSRCLLTGRQQTLPLRLPPGTYWMTVTGQPGGRRLMVE